MKRAKNKIIMFVVIGINVFILGFIISKTTNNLFYYGTNSENMMPNIREGDIIGLDTTAHSYTYGDIIYAIFPMKNGEYDHNLFRIVGLPGDTVAVKDNISIINGKVSESVFIDLVDDDPFIFEMYTEKLPNGKTYPIYVTSSKGDRDNFDTLLVPDSCYFLLGDSRSIGIDSRFIWLVPIKNIQGRVVEVNWVRIDKD